MLSARYGLPRLPIVVAIGCMASLFIAYVLVHRSPVLAVAVVAALPVGWLLTLPYGGVAVASVILFTLPYWLTVGSPQVSIIRIAAVLAALTAVIARRIKLRLIDFALLAYVVVVVLGWLLQYNEPHAGRIVSLELTPLGFYVGARAVPRERVPTIMFTCLIAGTLGALTLLYEVVLGHVVVVDPATYGTYSGGLGFVFRPAGIFGSPPTAATMLSFVILFGLGCVTVFAGRARILAWFCIGICSLALILTFTRGDLIGCGVGVLVFLWLCRPHLFRPLRVAWFCTLVAALTLVLLPKLESNATFQEGIVRPGTLASRQGFWEQALPIVTASTHNLVFGVGTATLEAPGLGSNAPIFSTLAVAPVVTEVSLQNQYMTTLVEQGLVGLVALLAFLLSAIIPAARAARRSKSGIHAALAASLVSVMVVMFVNSVLVGAPLFAILLTAAGLSGALAGSPRNDGPRVPAAKSGAIAR